MAAAPVLTVIVLRQPPVVGDAAQQNLPFADLQVNLGPVTVQTVLCVPPPPEPRPVLLYLVVRPALLAGA
jgi:hypothetical protein